MTTASKITLVRVLMIPVFMALLLLGYNIPALIVFIVASCTDFVDGYIARHYNQVSNFGKFLDPLADKLLVISCMLIFVQWGRMAAWAVMIVLAREFAVTGLRLVAVENGRVIAAAMSGKVKTFSTMVGLCVMIVLTQWAWLDWAITLVIVAVTLISGVEYFVKNRDVLDMKK
ncbi:MAG: CDP-diacylglycerol--glycerol-3-phosphate 3-phosphatidyltransferase [Oscillospiraceae bacterium]|nr:CDP-diacylglycerol--glycerol-3-phosphate 3-phosphatidyltransferase [Oscillospiraceae bacterium]